MVINHLLTGMILQVSNPLRNPSPFIKHKISRGKKKHVQRHVWREELTCDRMLKHIVHMIVLYLYIL